MTSIQTFIRRALASVSFSVLAAACITLLGPTQALGQAAIAEAWIAPDRAAHRVNPVASDKGSIKTARQLYDANCQKCHGKAGRGDGPQAQFLDAPPADLTSQAARDESDGALFWKISEGRGKMPKVNLAERDRWLLVSYIRSLQAQH